MKAEEENLLPSFLSYFLSQVGACSQVDCETVVFFANASDGQYSNERSEASVKTARENGERRLTQAYQACALHTRGSRLRRFAPSENVRKRLFCSLALRLIEILSCKF